MSCIIHIGFMKTGTTFLQQNFFPRLSLNYIQSYDDLKKPLINDITLFSSEAIGGSIYHKRDPEGMLRSFKQAILHLKNFTNDLRLIVCFREPKSFLISSYKQYLHEGGSLSFDKFFTPNGKGRVVENDLYFSKYIDFLLAHFSRTDLFLFNYNTFKTDTEKVLKALMDFMEVDVNSQLVQDALSARKKSNKSVPDLYIPLLILLNKADFYMRQGLGFGLRIKLFGILFSPRVMCQHLLPKFYSGRSSDVRFHLNHYAYIDDWKLVVKSLDM